MIQKDALSQIADILNTMHSEDEEKFKAGLEPYLTQLEIDKAQRPVQITNILKTLGAVYPVDLLVLLEAYISGLEKKDHASSSNRKTHTWDSDNPPEWSHKRFMQRRDRRQARAIQKVKNSYR